MRSFFFIAFIAFNGVLLTTALVKRDLIDMHMGSKTIYANRLQAGDIPPEQTVGQDCSEQPQGIDIAPAGCSKLNKVYALIRHGSRFPTGKGVKRGLVHGIDLNIEEQDHGLLTARGEQELFSLGQRMRQRMNLTKPFAEWLRPIKYHPQLFDLTSSQKPRVLQSAYAFSLGFFQGLGNIGGTKIPSVAIKSNDMNQDKLLRFHKACPHYQFKKKNRDANHEFQQLVEKHSATVLKMLKPFQSVLNRLKVNATPIENDDSISSMQISRALWEACQIAKILDLDDSYCQIFRENHDLLILMEFLHDAENHFFKGAADRINLDMSCLLRDEITSFFSGVRPTVGKYHQHKALFRFAHAETMIPLLAALPSFSDNDEIYTLRADPWSKEVMQRKWRTGMLVPMAANLVLESWECNGETKVRLFHNEKVISWCTNSGSNSSESLCSLSRLLELFQHKECDFGHSCSIPEEYNDSPQDDTDDDNN